MLDFEKAKKTSVNIAISWNGKHSSSVNTWTIDENENCKFLSKTPTIIKHQNKKQLHNFIQLKMCKKRGTLNFKEPESDRDI